MERKRIISEEVGLAFIEVAGLVWGIEMGRGGWRDSDMKLLNTRLVEIRDRLTTKLEKTYET